MHPPIPRRSVQMLLHIHELINSNHFARFPMSINHWQITRSSECIDITQGIVNSKSFESTKTIGPKCYAGAYFSELRCSFVDRDVDQRVLGEGDVGSQPRDAGSDNSYL